MNRYSPTAKHVPIEHDSVEPYYTAQHGFKMIAYCTHGVMEERADGEYIKVEDVQHLLQRIKLSSSPLETRNIIDNWLGGNDG